MKAKYEILMAGLVIALLSSGMIWAQEYPGEGEVQDSLLQLAEHERIEAQRYPRPEEFEQSPRREFEPREPAEGIEKVRAKLAELKEAAQQAEREGQPEKAAQMREKAKKLAEKIEAFAKKTKGRMPPKAEQRIQKLRDIAAEAEKRGELDKAKGLWAEVKELEGAMKREFERRPEEVQRPESWRPIRPEPPEGLWQRREVERRWPRPMEIEPRREGVRERPEPPGPWANLERMQKEIQDVLAVHLERMANQFRELQMHVERMERELQELRAENMRLKSQLREMPWSRKGPEREFREPGEAIKRQEIER